MSLSPDDGPERDVWVAGAGPAGFAMALALCDQGVSTGVLAPRPRDPWPATYGVWEHEVAGTRLDGAPARTLDRAWIRFDEGPALLIERPYLRLDGVALQRQWLKALDERGVPVLDARAKRVTKAADALGLETVDGRTHRCRAVIDATGNGVLGRRRREPRLHQVAYGRFGALEGEDLPRIDAMGFMDFRNELVDDGGPPTFLYVVPPEVDGGAWFLEETVLCAALDGSTESAIERCERRLAERVRKRGWRFTPLDDEPAERCVIAMDRPLPSRVPSEADLAVPFGAAAGLVHPASGYSLTRSLRRADRVAVAIAGEVSKSSTAEGLRRAAMAALWPESRRRSQALYTRGAELLAGFDTATLGRFFRAFFDIEDPFPFLAGEQEPAEVMALMWRVFGAADRRMQATLLGRSMGPLLKAAFTPS